jgi:hypothetical protein
VGNQGCRRKADTSSPSAGASELDEKPSGVATSLAGTRLTSVPEHGPDSGHGHPNGAAPSRAEEPVGFFLVRGALNVDG